MEKNRKNRNGNSNMKDKIINFLKKERKPIPVEILFSKMRLKKRDKALFLHTLLNIEREGQVRKNKKSYYFLSDNAEKLVRAKIVSMSHSFSFAKPVDDPKLADIFISNRDGIDALPGDVVLLSINDDDSRGPKGRVVKIDERAERLYNGTISENNDDLREHVRRVVAPDSYFRFPIALESASDRELELKTKVRFKVSFDKKGEIVANVVTIYGSSNSAKICADAIVDEAGIPYVFPEDVVLEAERLNEVGVSAKEIARRVDFRDKLIMTIDGADAKDLDDAISLEKTETGWELGVHIADVSHYVTAKSPIDEEAILRGTSVYFADRVIPMLPTGLSNGICSLNIGEDKLAFSVIINFNNNGDQLDAKLYKTVINTAVRGVYSEVNSIFDETADEQVLSKYESVISMLSQMKVLALKLKNNAAGRGTLELDSVESRFTLDEEGHPVDIVLRSTGESEGVIEQFMISANVAVAKISRVNKFPFIYRIHEQPDSEKLETLSDIARKLGLKNYKLESQIDMRNLMIEARETAYARLISSRLLRSMAKAKYSDDAVGHFGLALKDYSHFTSPIRRYPDLVIHRILTDFVSGVRVDDIKNRYSNFVKKASEISSQCEVRAVTAERNCEDCYKAEYMTRYLGQKFSGVVSSIANFGIFIELENSVEGLVRFESLSQANLKYDDVASVVTQTGMPIYTVGDEVEILVETADVSTGLVGFSIVED